MLRSAVMIAGVALIASLANARPCDCVDVDDLAKLADEADADAKLWAKVCDRKPKLNEPEDLLCLVMKEKGLVCPRDAGKDTRTAKVGEDGKVEINPEIASAWCDDVAKALEKHEQGHKEDYTDPWALAGSSSLMLTDREKWLELYRLQVCNSERARNAEMAKDLRDLVKGMQKDCCGWSGTVVFKQDAKRDEKHQEPDASSREAHELHVKATVKVHTKSRIAPGTVEVNGFILQAADSSAKVNCAESPLFPPQWSTSKKHYLWKLESNGTGAVEGELVVMVDAKSFSVVGQIPDVGHEQKLTFEDTLDPGCGKPTDASPAPPQPGPLPPGDPYPIMVEGVLDTPNPEHIKKTIPGPIEGQVIEVDLKKVRCP
jgi:hypothetical protein